MNLKAFNINPKTPLGCRITLGRQPPDKGGFPIGKDRFWICAVKAQSTKAQSERGERTVRYLDLAPGFERFNHDPFLRVEQWNPKQEGTAYTAAIDRLAAELKAPPEEVAATWRDRMSAHRRSRRELRGVIVHPGAYASARRGDEGALWIRRASQGDARVGAETIPTHPARAPACISEDGISARRWDGRAYQTIACKGDSCPFFAPNTGPMGSQACQKHATLLFQLRWHQTTGERALPSILAEIDLSGSYNHAADAIAGFFEDVRRQWRALAQPGEPDYYGLPFLLRLVHVAKPSANGQQGRAFWTVEMVLDLPDGMPLQEWLLLRARTLSESRALHVAPDVPLLAGPSVREAYLDARDLPDPGFIP